MSRQGNKITKELFRLILENGVDLTDWDAVRNQAAIYIAGRSAFYFDKSGSIREEDYQKVAKQSVKLADALVAELKKKGDNDD